MDVQSELKKGVLTLTLNRPPVNAFSLKMIHALQSALDGAAGDSAVRVVVLISAGQNFSAGHDVSEMLAAQGGTVSYGEHLKATYNPLVLQIRRIEKPVVAAINGIVAGAGLGVALACDIRIATESVRFTVGFSGIGLAPDSGVSILLPALIGLGRASEASFTNQPIYAEHALDWGLVNRLVPEAGLRSETEALAKRLAGGAVGAFGLFKRAFNKAILPDLEEALNFEAHLQEIASQGAEHREGVQAFIEKRAPHYAP